LPPENLYWRNLEVSERVIKKEGADQFSPYIRALIVGDTGSGKTSYATTFPNPTFITTGKNLTTLARNESSYIQIANENDLFNVKVALDKGEFTTDTLVIDMVEDLQDILFKQRFAAEKRDPWNVKNEDWNWLGAKMNGIFESLSELPVHILYLSRTKDVGGYDGEQLVVKPSVIGSFANQIYNYVDYALFLERRGPVEPESEFEEKTFLRTRPSVKYPWVNDKTDSLPNFSEFYFSEFLKSREISIQKSDEKVLEVDLLEPVTDAPNKDTEVPGMSKQDKIAKMLKQQ